MSLWISETPSLVMKPAFPKDATLKLFNQLPPPHLIQKLHQDPRWAAHRMERRLALRHRGIFLSESLDGVTSHRERRQFSFIFIQHRRLARGFLEEREYHVKFDENSIDIEVPSTIAESFLPRFKLTIRDGIAQVNHFDAALYPAIVIDFLNLLNATVVSSTPASRTTRTSSLN